MMERFKSYLILLLMLKSNLSLFGIFILTLQPLAVSAEARHFCQPITPETNIPVFSAENSSSDTSNDSSDSGNDSEADSSDTENQNSDTEDPSTVVLADDELTEDSELISDPDSEESTSDESDELDDFLSDLEDIDLFSADEEDDLSSEEEEETTDESSNTDNSTDSDTDNSTNDDSEADEDKVLTLDDLEIDLDLSRLNQGGVFRNTSSRGSALQKMWTEKKARQEKLAREKTEPVAIQPTARCTRNWFRSDDLLIKHSEFRQARTSHYQFETYDGTQAILTWWAEKEAEKKKLQAEREALYKNLWEKDQITQKLPPAKSLVTLQQEQAAKEADDSSASDTDQFSAENSSTDQPEGTPAENQLLAQEDNSKNTEESEPNSESSESDSSTPSADELLDDILAEDLDSLSLSSAPEPTDETSADEPQAENSAENSEATDKEAEKTMEQTEEPATVESSTPTVETKNQRQRTIRF